VTPTSKRRPSRSGAAKGTLYAWVQATWRPLVGRALAYPAILLVLGCSDKPPIVSADTSCERFRHISATEAQIKAIKENWEFWESYVDQIVEHNDQYDRQCIDPPPGAKK
jgi:hypothetical protein